LLFVSHSPSVSLRSPPPSKREALYSSDNRVGLFAKFRTVAQNGVKAAYECDYADLASAMTPTTVLLCDIKSELGKDTTLFISDRYADLAITYGAVRILGETDKEITVTTDTFLPYAMIDVPYLLSDNCFVLKKGEVKTLQKIRAI